MTRGLGRLLGWGTAASTSVMAVGAALELTSWRPAATAVILAAAAMFAALPATGLVLQLALYHRRGDLLYVMLTGLVLAIVIADAVIGG
ncbi:MAG TPA: hypothetical protein VMG38_08070 [Trebonia sp.]|nr:hypothetical protein [Trebonia sp.]